MNLHNIKKIRNISQSYVNIDFLQIYFDNVKITAFMLYTDNFDKKINLFYTQNINLIKFMSRH